MLGSTHCLTRMQLDVKDPRYFHIIARHARASRASRLGFLAADTLADIAVWLEATRYRLDNVPNRCAPTPGQPASHRPHLFRCRALTFAAPVRDAQGRAYFLGMSGAYDAQLRAAPNPAVAGTWSERNAVNAELLGGVRLTLSSVKRPQPRVRMPFFRPLPLESATLEAAVVRRVPARSILALPGAADAAECTGFVRDCGEGLEVAVVEETAVWRVDVWPWGLPTADGVFIDRVPGGVACLHLRWSTAHPRIRSSPAAAQFRFRWLRPVPVETDGQQKRRRLC